MTPTRLRKAIAWRFENHVLQPWRSWRNAARDLKPVFVAGAMGSGTSLLASALWQRFECGALAFESATWMDRRSFLHVPLVSSFRSIAEYRAFIEPHDGWSVGAARRDLLHLYRSVATQSGTLAIDKGPNTNLVRAEFLNACFEDANWVLIFRDPATNIEGFRRKWLTFGRDSLAESVRFYDDIHHRFLETIPRLGGRFMVIEYERLVEDFDAHLDEIGRRLGMRSAVGVRRLKPRANREGQALRNVSDNRIGVVRDASARSLARLQEVEIQQIRAALDPLHESLRSLARPGCELD